MRIEDRIYHQFCEYKSGDTVTLMKYMEPKVIDHFMDETVIFTDGDYCNVDELSEIL